MTGFQSIDLATLLLRLAAGGFMIPHGLQKLGFLGGDRAGDSQAFESWGFRPGAAWNTIVGIIQTGLGVLLVLGLLTPFAAVGVIVFMAVALKVELRRHGWYWQRHGMEYAIFWAVAAVAILLLGPGAWSVDHQFGLRL